MKRLHLFEFEDFEWFPVWLRTCMTRYLATLHRLLGSEKNIALKLQQLIRKSGQYHILDLCSGSGGPMLEVLKILRNQYGFNQVQLTLSDKYPDQQVALQIQQLADPAVNYLTSPLDAGKADIPEKGLRTLICSLHHMKPDAAFNILQNAFNDRQPIFVYEISDNSFPRWSWWMVIPINIIAVFFITPLVRPFSWVQLVFTYIIPVLPIFIAWDGAVSNARTYTLEDLEKLLEGKSWVQYQWEKGLMEGKGGRKIYLMGIPDQQLG